MFSTAENNQFLQNPPLGEVWRGCKKYIRNDNRRENNIRQVHPLVAHGLGGDSGAVADELS